MTSAQGSAYLIEAVDYPVCKNLALVKEYKHPDQTFGCAWNPFNANEFITACQDGIVRLYDSSCGDDNGQPQKTFEGHTKKIYNVVYSPSLPGIAASGSDDKTICIWRTDGNA